MQLKIELTLPISFLVLDNAWHHLTFIQCSSSKISVGGLSGTHLASIPQFLFFIIFLFCHFHIQICCMNYDNGILCVYSVNRMGVMDSTLADFKAICRYISYIAIEGEIPKLHSDEPGMLSNLQQVFCYSSMKSLQHQITLYWCKVFYWYLFSFFPQTLTSSLLDSFYIPASRILQQSYQWDLCNLWLFWWNCNQSTINGYTFET